MRVILKPVSPLWNVSVAFVRISCGGVRWLLSPDESAMLKQAAWAAAISSSGLLPVACSKREEYVIVASCNTPLSVDALPVPVRRSPDQDAVACRSLSAIVG